MKSRVRMGVLVAAIATCFGACEDATGPDPVEMVAEETTAAAARTPEAARQAAIRHPVELSVEGESRIIGWCDESAGTALVLVTGVGTMTHIGRFETEQTNCISLATGAITDGEAVVFTANGDEIHMTYAGRVLPSVDPQTLELTYLTCGGTGRFVRAEGVSDLLVVYSSETEWTAWGEGWLSYAASDRADS